MPKQRITLESVITAAFELARENGIESITVKKISDKLSCSVQPIYTYCANMDGLRKNVIEKSKAFVKSRVSEILQKSGSTDIFKETGRAYLQIAKEEPNIFKMFILHQRENISSLDDLYSAEADPKTAEAVSQQLNITLEEAKKIHMNMLIYNIGIGTVLAGTTPGIPTEEIFSQQEYAYKAFLNLARGEKRTAPENDKDSAQNKKENDEAKEQHTYE